MSGALCKSQIAYSPFRQHTAADLNRLFVYDPEDPMNPAPRGRQNARRNMRTLKRRRRMAKRSAA